MHNDWKVVESLAHCSRLFLPLTLKRKSLIPLPVRTQITHSHILEGILQASDIGEPVIRNVTGLTS